jgi:hypothetical protein
MAKGRDRRHKKESRHGRNRGAAAPQVLKLPVSPLPMPIRRGVEATRGPVSGAYRSWVMDLGRRKAQEVATALSAQGASASPDLFLLAPLTTRTVEAPSGKTVNLQMGLPIVATRAGAVTIAPDQLAVLALRLPDDATGGALAMLSMGQAPDLPPPEMLFALRLPAEGLRALRAADAVAWYLARGVEAGDVDVATQALANAAAEVLALLRPNAVSRDVPRLDPAALDAYEGYGTDADEDPVPLDITAPPARGGLRGLPSGNFLKDSGAPLAPLLADLRDYVVGLWPYEYLGLAAVVEHPAPDGAGRAALLAEIVDLVRRVDDLLARTSETLEKALEEEGQPPAWIAEETAPYRDARQLLRAVGTAQEMLSTLGPILFNLEIPPDDYVPEGWSQDGEDEEEDD